MSVQAAARGLIDFREARFDDPNWWRRCRAMFGELTRQLLLEEAQARLVVEAGLVANSRLTDDSWKAANEGVRELLNDIAAALRPWSAASRDQRLHEQAAGYRQQYQAAFGIDPSTPAFKQWESRAVERMLVQSGAVAAETTEQRLERGFREREARRLERQGRR